MNLRDKLRNNAEAPVLDEDETIDAPVAEAKVPKGKAKKAKSPSGSLASQLPKLDVNRRFLVLAGAAAALTSLMAVVYLNNAGSGLASAGAKISVVVLSEDVTPGMPLTEDKLTTAEVPAAYLPKGYIEDMDKLKNFVAIAPMVAGEPVIEARVSPPDAKHGIAYLLKPGERAKTISVDSASGLAGLIKPGNEVDLLATIPDPNNDGRHISTPILQKARVIAVGNHLLGEIPKVADEDGNVASEDNGISSENTVTLAVPGSKTGVVGLLEKVGNLSMVLRAAGDDSREKPKFSDDVIMSLVSGKLPPKQVAAPPRPVAQRPIYIPQPVREVIREVERPAPPKPAPARPRPAAVSKPAPVSRPIPVSKPAQRPAGVDVIRFGGN